MSNPNNEKKNGLGLGGILLLVIDVVLLVIIMASVIKKDEVVTDSETTTVANVDNESDNESAKVDISNQETVEEPEPLDTEGIEGIVDIEDEPIDTEPEDIAQDTVAEVEEEQFDVSDYSTTARPSLSDFMWYFDNVHYNGIPSEATYIYDSEQIVGDWKGFIFYDPERKMNSYGVEFLNVNLKIDGQKADVAFDLYELYFENTEVINEEGGPLLNYSGNFEAGAVYATGGGNVHIDTFYTMPDKKQYAVGYLDTPDGTPAYLALVRP